MPKFFPRKVRNIRSQCISSTIKMASDTTVVLTLVYVVVQFYPWFNFYFPLFFFMLIYDNEYKTKENKNRTKDKIELQH